MAGALEGIRILDLSRVLAGPWATQLLADLGAEVVKIEKPGKGDDTRHWGPPFVARGEDERDAAYFLCANRGKRSVAIDMARPEGQALIRALSDRCDVLVENFKVGGLAKYGLDYASLAALNPRLIYCSITGFGQTGPCAHRPGYDSVAQALGGMMSLTGEPDGEPMKSGVALTDILTGLYAANAIQAALRHRDQTGQGQWIDMALLDVQVAVLANQAFNYLISGENPRRFGNAHPNIVPYQTFRTADGWIMLAVGNDTQFARLCQVLDRPDLAALADYATNDRRVQNRETLTRLLQTLLEQRGTGDWLDRLGNAKVPADAINTVAEVFAHPQVIHRRMQATLPTETGADLPTVSCPIKMSITPPTSELAPPRLGQDTYEVLRNDLGLSAEALDGLAAKNVIQGSPASASRGSV